VASQLHFKREAPLYARRRLGTRKRRARSPGAATSGISSPCAATYSPQMRTLGSVGLAALALASLLACVLAPAAHAAPGTRTLYLVRHGVYDRNTTLDDHVGNGLNALGREQAAAAGKYLARLPVTYTKLVSSTLARA
jgi:hypothetical protein